MGEVEFRSLRLQFDRFDKLAFQGSSIGSDGGMLLHHEPDDTLGLIDVGAVKHGAVSASAMGWFEAEMLTRPRHLPP